MFATTRWSLVAAAQDPAAPESRQALADLCAAYEVQLYPQWQLGESWRFFLSLYLYWFASYALSRAVSFAKGSIAP